MITLEKVLGQAIQLPLEQQRILATILQHHCHPMKLGDSENSVEQLDFRLVTKFNLVMPAEKLCFVMFKIRQAELAKHSLPS